MKGEKNLDMRGTEIRSKYICTMHIAYCIHYEVNHKQQKVHRMS